MGSLKLPERSGPGKANNASQIRGISQCCFWLHFVSAYHARSPENRPLDICRIGFGLILRLISTENLSSLITLNTKIILHYSRRFSPYRAVNKTHLGYKNPLVKCLFSIHINSDVCHPRCVFKLYGEVNSVKNTTYKYMAKWWCLLAMVKTTCFGL
jgi:hypothetical protein